jgi:Zn-dependent protease with chaperone function
VQCFNMDLQLILTPAVIIALYLTFTYIVAESYHYYLRKPFHKEPCILFGFALIMLAVMVECVVLYLWYVLWSILGFVTFAIIGGIVILASLPALNYLRGPKCSETRWATIDNRSVIECVNGPVNAWLSEEGIVIIGDRLREVLSREELNAVYYHEEGHGRGLYALLIRFFSVFIIAFWWLSMATLFIVDLLQRLGVFRVQGDLVLALVGCTIPTGWLLALEVMMWMWIYEHEADLYSVNMMGLPHYLVAALVKIHIYRSLERDKIFWQRIGLSVQLNVPKASSIVQEPSTREIFKTLVKGTMLSFIGALQDHPPPSLRLYMLSHIP